MANKEKAFGERKLALIHPSDGKKENAVSSVAKVETTSRESKERTNGGRAG